MWNLVESMCLFVGDGLLGWLLAISPAATIVVLAIGSAVMFVFIRRFAASQQKLAELSYDRRRVSEFTRQARTENDGEAVTRLTQLQNVLGWKRLAAEWRPLLISILPLLILGTWAGDRLAAIWPGPGEAFVLRLQTPYSAVGRVVHLQPNDALSCLQWVCVVEPTEGTDPPAGEATWIVKRSPEATTPVDPLVVVWGDQQVFHPLSSRLGEPSLVVRHHENGTMTELTGQRLDFQGWLAWLPTWFPPWLLVYLALTIAVTRSMQWLFGVL